MSAALRQSHQDISRDLDRIAKRFKDPVKITLMVRNPGRANVDVFLSDDDFESAFAAARNLQDRGPI